MMSWSSLWRRLLVLFSTALMTLGLVIAAGATAQAAPPPPPRPMPPGGTSASLLIVNQTGWPLMLDVGSTGLGAGSSDPVRWITPPPGRLGMRQSVTVRAWTPNMWMMSVRVGYSVQYRQAMTRYRLNLEQMLGNTTLGDTGATPGHQVMARVIIPSPRMSAVYVLR